MNAKKRLSARGVSSRRTTERIRPETRLSPVLRRPSEITRRRPAVYVVSALGGGGGGDGGASDVRRHGRHMVFGAGSRGAADREQDPRRDARLVSSDPADFFVFFSPVGGGSVSGGTVRQRRGGVKDFQSGRPAKGRVKTKHNA